MVDKGCGKKVEIPLYSVMEALKGYDFVVRSINQMDYFNIDLAQDVPSNLGEILLINDSKSNSAILYGENQRYLKNGKT